MFRIIKSVEAESRLVVARESRVEGMTANGPGMSFWSNENVSKIECAESYATLCNSVTTVKTNGLYILKDGHFSVEFHHNKAVIRNQYSGKSVVKDGGEVVPGPG